MVSFTITEKGYSLCNSENKYLDDVMYDITHGPKYPTSIIGKLTALLFERYRVNEKLALVSMDNFSHNGDVLKNAVINIANMWFKKVLLKKTFLNYLNDEEKITFPLSVIDKIVPRPSEVKSILEKEGIYGDGYIMYKEEYIYSTICKY